MAANTAIIALSTLAFCAATALLIGAYKAHKVLQNQTSAVFLASFSLIATGLLLQLVVETYPSITIQTIQTIQALTGVMIGSNLLLILSSLLILSAYMLLLLAAEKIQNNAMRILSATTVVLAVIIGSQLYAVTHLTAAILTSLLAYRFYKNFLVKNSTNALIVYLAFLCLLIGHTAALFSQISLVANYIFYSLQLIGYFALFYMLWRVRQ